MKKPILSALIFFGTLMMLTIGYAAWNSPLIMNTVSSGDTLTANILNALINNINDLNDRVTTLTTPKGTLQFVQNHYASATTYAGSATRPGNEITALATTITTMADNSKIVYDLLLSGESHHNNVFILQRDIGGIITELGTPVSPGSRTYGITHMTFDTDNASTLNRTGIQFIDSPNVAAGTVITYRVRFYGDGAYTLYLNRTLTDTDSTTTFERATSNVRLQEFK